MATHANITPNLNSHVTASPPPNRRELCAAAGAIILGSGITASAAASVADLAEQPDAALLAACAEYLRIQRAWSAYCEALDGDVKDNDPNNSMLDPLTAIEERIVALRATTAEGHVARARCMAFSYLPKHSIAQGDPDSSTENRFQAALYRDLIAQERSEVTIEGIAEAAVKEHGSIIAAMRTGEE